MVKSPSFSMPSNDDSRVRTRPERGPSNCGARVLKMLSKFQIAASASASNGAPSWKRTPRRSSTTHRRRSPSSTRQEVARPGTRPEARSSRDRSQFTKAS